MKVIIAILGLLSVTFAVHAQETAPGQTALSGQTGDEAEQLRQKIREEADQLNDYKAYLKKDSILSHSSLGDTLKQAAKQALKDSARKHLPGVALDSALIDTQVKQAKGILKDSVEKYTGGIALDSTTADQVKEKARAKASKTLEQETGLEVQDIQVDSTTLGQVKEKVKTKAMAAAEDASGIAVSDIALDSTTIEKVKKEGVKQAEDLLKETDEYKALNDLPKDSKLGQMEDYKAKFEQKQEQLRQQAARQALKKKMTMQAKKYIREHADKIQKIQAQMGKLKKKYSYMPNSNDLSTAVKRSSLKGETLWKRLVIGGNFNISKTNPLRIDLSPVIGYRINKLFEAGITGAFRTQFSADKNGINAQRDKEVYGYSVFASHMAFKNFFGYLEGERMRTTTQTEDPQRVWKQTLLMGVGRKIAVTKWLEMQALVLFNVLHDNQDGIYNSPVVFKTGFRVRK